MLLTTEHTEKRAYRQPFAPLHVPSSTNYLVHAGEQLACTFCAPMHDYRRSTAWALSGDTLWIERATHALAAALQHMRIDHGGADILVAQEFLHGTNIIATL